MSATEIDRVRAVKSLNIIGSAPEPEFDRLARLAGHIVNADYAKICFVDEQNCFVKATSGLMLPTLIARELSVCADTVSANAPLIIEDLAADDRPNYRNLHRQYGLTSYVSVPIRWTGGHAVGAVAALSVDKGVPSQRRLAALQECANLVSRELLIRQASGEGIRRGAASTVRPVAATPDLVRAITRNHLSVLKSVSDGVIAVRGDGVINFVNPAAERILGRSAASMLGSTFHDIFNVSATGAVIQDIRCPVAASLHDGKERLAKRAYCLGGDRAVLKIEYAVSPVNAQANIIGAVIVFRRVTSTELPNGVELRDTLREVSRLREQIARLAAAQTSVDLLAADDATELRALPSTRFEELLRVIDKEHSDQALRARAWSADSPSLLSKFAALPGPVPAVLDRPLAAEPPSRVKSRVGRWLES